MNPTPGQPLTPDSLRTLGVEVGRHYLCPLDREISVVINVETTCWAKIESKYDAIYVPLTTLSQARSLLAGLGVEMETRMATKPRRTDEYPIEAKVAAKWWADLFRDPPSRMFDNGDGMQEIIAEVITGGNRECKLTPGQVDLFEELLAAIVTEKFVKADYWQTNNPLLGSGLRTLAVDYGACEELRAAYQGAGGPIKGLCPFPIKTVMWVSPNSVKVRQGYGGQELVLLPRK